MPLLYLAVRWNFIAISMVSLLAVAIFSQYAVELHRLTLIEPSIWLVHKFIFTFILCFFVGALATTVSYTARSKLDKLNFIVSVLFRHRIILSLVVLIVVRPISNLRMEYAILIEMVAAAVIVHDVYYCNSGWLQRIASHRWAHFYGRISYSFYMFSGIGIYASALVIYNILGKFEMVGGLMLNILVTLLSIIIVTLISVISYRWVEQPLMRIGKDISRMLEG
jgi:peptidoglycan/LPS O-acetylase OafA/YrhL